MIQFSEPYKVYKICDICGYRTKHNFQMQYHMQAVHVENVGDFSFECNQCNFSIFSSIAMESHKRTTHLTSNTPENSSKRRKISKSSTNERKVFLHIKCDAENRKRLHCSICSFTCINKPWMMRHMRYKHEERTKIRCDFCGFSCFMKSEIKTHIEAKHAPKDTYKCRQCNYTNSSEHNLKVHIKLKHIEKLERPICHECGKVFKNPLSLQKHMRIHELGLSADNVCKVCNIKYPSDIRLIVHTLNVHMNQKPEFSCPQCPKSYYFEASLKNHIRSLHMKTIRCQDENCSKLFPNEQRMKIHYKIHHEKVRHLCSHCGRSFISEPGLETHIRNEHLGEIVKFPCQLCSNTYKSEIGLRKHMIHHTAEAKFQCNQCQKRMYTKTELEQHQKRHLVMRPRAKEFACELCPPGMSNFTTASYLKEHTIKKHTDVKAEKLCKYCDKKFVTTAQRRAHIVHTHYVENGSYKQCDQCEKVFANIRRLQHHKNTVHDGLRYRCTLCPTTFSQKDKKIFTHYQKKHANSEADMEIYKEIIGKIELN